MPFLANANIDLKSLSRNKKNLLNIILVILALFIGVRIYSWQSGINRGIRKEIASEVERNDLLEQLAVSEKRVSYYRELLKKREVTSVINIINQLIEKTGIKLVLIRPEPEREGPLYTKQAIGLFILADSYHKIGDFINRLESSSDLYKIERLIIKPNVKGDVKSGLSVEIIVASIAFKG